MWRLAYPWVLTALPLAWAAWRGLPIYVPRRSALRVPFFERVTSLTGVQPEGRDVRMRGVQAILNLLVWALLVVAVARPVYVEPPVEHREAVRDVLLAIDISQSMQARDFTNPDGAIVDRVRAVQQVVGTFIDRRRDDRIGLIVFGSAAYPQAPLTQDHGALRVLLDQIAPGMAGPNTSIGDAIGLAIRQFDRASEPQKVLILLSDGNDTGSAVPPAEAADMAKARHITVHAIGIGNPATEGENAVNFDTLRQIAGKTGGRFFEARDRSALEQVYAELDRITPHDARRYLHQPEDDYYWIPLGAALVLLALSHCAAAWRSGWRHLSAKAATWRST